MKKNAILALPLLLLLICSSLAQKQHLQKHSKNPGGRPADRLGFQIRDWKTPVVDQNKAIELGIRKLEGEHLTLYTDLPSSPAIDTLPAIFDKAFPQWCEFLGISKKQAKNVHLTGSLMKSREPFEAAGILPSNVPKFEHGFAVNDWFWMFDQESDYYRRHLILHEGVHGLMNKVLGSCGPPWYMESTAEYLGTHRIDADGNVTVGIFPKGWQEVPMWGRVSLIHKALRASRGRTLDEVLQFKNEDYYNDETYAWSWLVAMLLDKSPETQKIYRGMAKHVNDPRFNVRFRRRLRNQWDDLARQWLILIDTIEYGHDLQRTKVDMKPGQPLGDDAKTVQVAADRGWQNSGIELQAGKTYRLTAEGSYRVVKGDGGFPDWMSEPGGVSIRYHRGRPLGLLQAMILPKKAGNSLLKPIDVGLETTITPETPGTLLLRINDSPATLEDNEGEATVRVEKAE